MSFSARYRTSSVVFFLTSSTLLNLVRLRTDFGSFAIEINLWKEKKSHGAKSDEYGEWSRLGICFSVKNFLTDMIAQCALVRCHGEG